MFAMMRSSAGVALALFATVAYASCSHNKDCSTCVSSQDTSGWYTVDCKYCSSSGLCSGSIYDSCSSGSWLSTPSSCPAPAPPQPGWATSSGSHNCPDASSFNACLYASDCNSHCSSHPGCGGYSLQGATCYCALYDHSGNNGVLHAVCNGHRRMDGTELVGEADYDDEKSFVPMI